MSWAFFCRFSTSQVSQSVSQSLSVCLFVCACPPLCLCVKRVGVTCYILVHQKCRMDCIFLVRSNAANMRGKPVCLCLHLIACYMLAGYRVCQSSLARGTTRTACTLVARYLREFSVARDCWHTNLEETTLPVFCCSCLCFIFLFLSFSTFICCPSCIISSSPFFLLCWFFFCKLACYLVFCIVAVFDWI